MTYSIHAEIPGAKKDDTKLIVEGNQISISAEVRGEAKKQFYKLARECAESAVAEEKRATAGQASNLVTISTNDTSR